jgi:hypothetical protein
MKNYTINNNKKVNKILNVNDLDKVAGGMSPGDEYITEEEVEYCDGVYENGRHEWVRTGRHKEESFFIFWTIGYDEYVCTKCGATKWVH